MSEIAIVGGGAAGMAAAIAAAESGSAVTIYEKNEKLGKKLFITGKGRCNVTNDCDMDALFDGVVTNRRFLYSAFYGFTNQDMMELMEKAGCPLKTERGGRVFPVSDKSSDVIRALEKRMKALGVTVRLNEAVKGLILEDGCCRGILTERVSAGKTEHSEKTVFGGKQTSGGSTPSGKQTSLGTQERRADAVILASGGLSYATTGSTGDGYRLASAAGHSVTETLPALVPLTTAEDVGRELQGLALKNIEIRLLDGKKELYRDFGEMLFTHFGVSGPVILSASSFVVKKLMKKPLKLAIDLKPALTAEQLDARLLRDFEDAKNKQFKNALGHLYPASLIPVVIGQSGISPEKKVNEITREERRRLVEITKGLAFTLNGARGFNEAIITQGGIRVKEVNPSTMESKLAGGLYFAGEMLDLDAVTGGYNLQIAWSTGWLAGKSAAGG